MTLSLFQSILGNRTLCQYMQLASSHGLSIGLSFVATWTIARGLAVQEFGQYRFAMAFLALGVTLLHLGWPHAVARLVARESDEQRRREIHAAAFLLVMLSTAVTSGLIVIALYHGLGGPLLEYRDMMIWFSPCVVLPLLSNMCAAICQGENNISLLASAQVAPYLVILPVTIVAIWGLASYDIKTALLIYAVSWFLVNSFVATRLGLSWQNVCAVLGRIHRENLQNGAKIYLGGVFAVASTQFITLLVAEKSASDSYGHYTLALATTAPVALGVSSIGTVIFQRSAKMTSLPRSLWFSAAALGAGAWVTFALSIDLLLRVAFSPDYAPAGALARWTVTSAVLTGWGDILQRFLSAHGYGTPLSIAAIATGLAAVGVAYFFLGPLGVFGAIWSNIAAASVYLGSMLFLYHRHRAALLRHVASVSQSS